MTLTIWHVIGILATLAVIVGVSIYSGRSVKSAADFDRGGSSGPWLVAGAIMGALVSGQATVGTAQLAYSYGLAAWWFTLGAGIGCLLLAVGYVVPLRHSGSTTLLGIVSQRYGKAAGYWGSVLCSLGIFISVIAQVISATALLTTIFPMGMGAAALVSVAIMTLYVVFGGVTGAGMGGVVKLFLLYLACIVGSLTVWSLSGGVTPLLGRVSDLCQAPGMDAVLGLSGGADAFHTRFLSLVARGPLKDVGSGISLLLGVLSTQTYAQAIWSARSDSAARKGALLSALLIPPIGIACILIGLYMRAHYITTAEVQALAALGQAVPPGAYGDGLHLSGFPHVCGKSSALLGGRCGAGHPLHHHRARRFRSLHGRGFDPGQRHLQAPLPPAGRPQDGSGGHPHHHYRGPALRSAHCRIGPRPCDQRLWLPLHGAAGRGGICPHDLRPLLQGADF